MQHIWFGWEQSHWREVSVPYPMSALWKRFCRWKEHNAKASRFLLPLPWRLSHFRTFASSPLLSHISRFLQPSSIQRFRWGQRLRQEIWWSEACVWEPSLFCPNPCHHRAMPLAISLQCVGAIAQPALDVASRCVFPRGPWVVSAIVWELAGTMVLANKLLSCHR